MRNLFIVDVFAERRYAGNQLAVVVSKEPIAPEEMQAIAEEMNYSETTFVSSGPEAVVGNEASFAVRIFTPTQELPFAGHPILGTGAVLRDHVLAEPASSLTLITGIGPIPLRFEEDNCADLRVWMRPGVPTLGDSMARGKAAALLGLSPDELHPLHDPIAAAIGIGFILVPLASTSALDRVSFDLTGWRALRASGLDAIGIFAFVEQAQTEGNDLAARMFFDAGGAREDPATGSANTCLAGWLASTRPIPESGLCLRVEQGVAMGRPSIIHLGISRGASNADSPAAPSIEVGGGVILSVKGELV
ncbi:MAG: trans-2,3-dihydro-3-hydroxyanthranilate isomerase [Hyphomicrobiaceae bacterium]|jgi:trans-2,3-dihydro-3-hydroxyanthranilate isomerase